MTATGISACILAVFRAKWCQHLAYRVVVGAIEIF